MVCKTMILLFSGCVLCACAEIKQTGTAVGHTTRDVTREIGHGTRDVAKEIGHGTRAVVKGIGHGFRDAAKEIGHGVREAVDESRRNAPDDPEPFHEKQESR